MNEEEFKLYRKQLFNAVDYGFLCAKNGKSKDNAHNRLEEALNKENLLQHLKEVKNE